MTKLVGSEATERKTLFFKKSRNVGRTPIKSRRKMKENIQMMMNMMLGANVNDMTDKITNKRRKKKCTGMKSENSGREINS